MTRRPTTSSHRRSTKPELGRLVFVVASDQAGLAVLLDAASRRFLSDQRVQFAATVTTHRTTAAGARLVVSRRDFHDLVGSGGFLATWHHGEIQGGLPIGVRDTLNAGISVVAGLPHEDVCNGAGTPVRPWSDVCFLRVTTHTDLARVPLNPRACLQRMMGPGGRPFDTPRHLPARTDGSVHVGASIGAGVSAISDAIERLLTPPPRPRAPGERMRARAA